MTSSSARPARPRHLPVVLLGALSLIGYGSALALEATSRPADVHQFLFLFGILFALYGGALWWALRSRRILGRPAERSGLATLRTVIGFAVAFRLIALFAGLEPTAWSELPQRLMADLEGRVPAYQPFFLYDNDAWRYLWDGRVLLAGLDPWASSPVELEAAMDAGDTRAEWVFAGDPNDLRASTSGWQIYDRLSFRQYRGIYPPLALLTFAGLQIPFPGSLFAWKILVALLDIGTVLLLAGCARRWQLGILPVLVYGWNPLAVKELAGSGHVDALMIALVVSALWLHAHGYFRAALAVLSVSVMAKVASVLLLPWMLARSGWRKSWAIGAGGLPLLPFVPRLGGWFEAFRVFQKEWAFNASLWSVTAKLAEVVGSLDPEARARGMAMILSILVALFVAWRAPRGESPEALRSWLRGGLVVLAVPLLIGSTAMPWYLLWCLPLAALGDLRSPWVWTATIFLSYLVYAEQIERLLWLGLEYGLLGLAILIEIRFRPDLRADFSKYFQGRSTSF